MPTPEARSERLLKKIYRLVITVLAVMAFVVVGGRYSAVSNSRDQCNRSKKGALVIGPALQGQADYLDLVLQAKSVKQDVKDAAAVNQAKQQKAADVLNGLNGKLDCTKKYKFIPGLF